MRVHVHETGVATPQFQGLVEFMQRISWNAQTGTPSMLEVQEQSLQASYCQYLMDSTAILWVDIGLYIQGLTTILWALPES